MKKKKILKADFCVIGAGSGGLSFAAGAVQMGASVILLEGDKMGGDCLNYGCVPSKALIAAAKASYDITKADKFGIQIDEKKVDYTRVHNHIHSVIAAIEPNDSIERFEKLGVKVVTEKGAFKDKKSVETDSYIIKAKKFIIATGSKAFVPPIKGIESVDYYTNENIFDLKELPKHLVVIGGGPIGIELAQSFNRLGAQVTVLEASSALPKDDQKLTKELKKILIEEGISLNEKVSIEGLSQDKNNIIVKYKIESEKELSIKASHVLIATGRRANISSLKLDNAKIEVVNNAIKVDKNLRTSNKKAYAIGDCTGGYQFTHVAGYHASISIKNSIFKLPSKVQTKAIPWVTYTDPELAHVGYLEEQIKEQGIKYKVLEMDLKESDRAQAELKTNGYIKVLCKPNGKILGASILGKNSGELIYPWVMAIQNDLKISAIANSIAPYPTYSDINKRVAGSFYTDKIFSSKMQKFVKFMMKWFG